MNDSSAGVRAAGGVLVRDGLIALVHRPRYDDWTLPKGKLTRGEHPLAAACREVEEETGVRPIAGARLASVSYRITGGEKIVEYWAMTVGQDGGFTPGREIDEVRWLDPAAAAATLSYANEIEVLAAHREMPPVTAVIAIVRHATAGGRDSWPGQDSARPLDPAGTVQAADLASVLRWYVPRRLVSAPPRRCVQTLAPLAGLVDAAIEVESAFGEAADPVRAAGRIRGLARTAPSIVVCSQGGLIPPLLAALVPGPHPTPKGTGWVLAFAGDDIVAVEPLGV